MERDSIAANVKHILETLPPGVILIAVAKARTPEEVKEALQAGVTHVGHNYVQEAERVIPAIKGKAHWHMSRHLQKNRVKSCGAL